MVLEKKENQRKTWINIFRSHNSKNNRFDIKAFKSYFGEEERSRFETIPDQTEKSR